VYKRDTNVITIQRKYNHFNINHFQIKNIYFILGIKYHTTISGMGPKRAFAKIQAHSKLENTIYYNE